MEMVVIYAMVLMTPGVFLVLRIVGVNGIQMNTERLELAKRLASRINMAKNLGSDAKAATQQAAEAILKGGPSQPLITVGFPLP